ncbi:glycosyl hydrolase family 18 protein, partial [Cellulomonas sp.]|uniref:glycosyl hydrolase family 18 protein n=1 Tax=Cellulomonas sp. TaxID=40001 RepID=UPI001AFF9223
MACPHRGLSARLRRLALLLVIGLPVPGMASPPSSTASAQPARLQVIGYVVDEPQLPPISAGKLDAINFAFAKVDATGAAYLPGDTATRSLAALTALRADNPALKVLVSIGGWGAGNFSEAALTPASRARFTDSAVALLRAHDLDGIDIDWEYPTLPGPGISHRPEDRRNFSLM